MTSVPDVTLNNGIRMPQLGFGVFQVPQEQTAEAIRHALAAGYRSIDTATLYRNEEGVGEAVAASGLARDELFVTTKLWNTDQGYDSALKGFDASLARLNLDYVDLYLIHWPVPGQDRYVDTWKAFETIYADGRARAIGVSNFQASHLRRLLDETGIIPAVNQVELHPQLAQLQLRAFHAEHGIATEAWSPLAKGGDLLTLPVVTDLADRYRKSSAQVILRWHVQLGNIVIPKSVTPSRIQENIQVFDFELTDSDMSALSALDSANRTGPHPER